MNLFGSTRYPRPTVHARHAPRGALLVVCLGAALSLLAGASAAQADPRLTGGVRLAFSVTDVKAAQEYDPRFGIGGGGFLQGKVWRMLDLRVEANYLQKGGRQAASRSSIEWQMDYIEVPFLLVVNLAPKSKTSVEICVGPTYGFPLQRQVEVGDDLGYDLEGARDTGQEIFVNPTTNLIIRDVEKSDLGYAVGVGLSVPVGAVNFLVDARYTSAITDPAVTVDSKSVVGEGASAVTQLTTADFSNRAFMFFFGFAFPLGERGGSE